MIDPNKINSEVTQGNLQLERVLNLLANDSDSLFNMVGKHYLVIDSSNENYADIFKRLQKKHYDGSYLIYNDLETVDGLLEDGDTVFIAPFDIEQTETDPSSLTENAVITASNVKLIGLSSNRTQGGLPQLKVGSTTTSPIITIRNAGVQILNLGFNGAGATGGGILLDDDGGTSKVAFGTSIIGCHFKNCKGSTATDCRTGGAIMWAATGGAWQVEIKGNQFYKNVGDVVLKGTTGSVPQDVVIANNDFLGLATSVDCHLYLAGGSGMASVMVKNNHFADVLPALGSGSIVRYADLTGCTGLFSNNYFGGVYTTTGFGAAKAAAKIPTTVGMPHNYSDSGLIVREA
jgi:hypothetical protein